jgi:uncharacterized membrane protein (DUF485 family)
MLPQGGAHMAAVDPIVSAIAEKRWRVALTLSVLVLVVYFGFIFLVAFGKPFLSTLVMPGLSVGILLGAATIVSCWILCLIYVVWANSGYDEEVADAARSRRAS